MFEKEAEEYAIENWEYYEEGWWSSGRSEKLKVYAWKEITLSKGDKRK